MRSALALIFCTALVGCGVLDDLLFEEPLLTLSPYPVSSGCSRSECQKLDAIEAGGYELARAKKITWVNFVDTFYGERNKLFPNAQEDDSDREYRAYQRVLAEQMDNNRISESQWVYLLEKKKGDLRSRDELLRNSRPREQNCVTEKTGLPPFERYQTRCN